MIIEIKKKSREPHTWEEEEFHKRLCFASTEIFFSRWTKQMMRGKKNYPAYATKIKRINIKKKV